MKHSIKIVAILLFMFLITQLIGIAVVYSYSINNDALPYGMAPPKNISPEISFVSIIIAIIFAVFIMLIIMRFNIEFLLKLWFMFVITIAIAITINSVLFGLPNSSIIALLIAIILAILKIFRQNILIHNFTELLIYPGIAAIFVPLLNVFTIILLFLILSIYDIYAVWHSGFMQRMAKYQIQKLKMFSGFFVPYIGAKEKAIIVKMKKNNIKEKKIKLNLAILGGGDVVFPIIFAGVILRTFGFVPSLITIIGATLSLFILFIFSKKGKFYPAMPFISAGCFIALSLVYILKYLFLL
ncbi:MAG: presenilin family intramembrane aspartyl protease [Candidatus Pacearchaeota archaeon]|nr:presenilin family intramembrane aspartyl protease [Candidatus Pacearchaeota archaeon]